MDDLYPILSPTFKVPGSNEVRFQHLNFRLGWTREAPYRIAIQLSNPTYGDQKIKFAVRDLTMNQTVLLDLEHNTYFIQETLHPNQEGTLWSGTVSNLTDSFALKVWDSDGDSFEQTPITISSAWTEKPHPAKPHPSPTPSSASLTTDIETPVPPPATNAKPALTATATRTMTTTATPTPTATATPCQTAAPFFSCVLAVFGDSFTSRYGFDPKDRNYKGLTIQALQRWYPGVEATINDVVVREGCDPGCWAHEIDGWLDRIIQSNPNVPIGYALFQTGNCCFYYAPDPGHDGCKGASVSEGVSISYTYQKYMDYAIGRIYAKCPDIHLVVLGIADTTGGSGHFAPPEVYQAYNQRLFELKAKYPQMRIADLYKAIGSHSEYFHHNDQANNAPPHPGRTASLREMCPGPVLLLALQTRETLGHLA